MKKRRTKTADPAAKPAAGGDSPAVSPAAATPAEVSDDAEGEAPAEVEAPFEGVEANHADAADQSAPEEGATNEGNGEEGAPESAATVGGNPESAATEGVAEPEARPDLAAMLAEAEERGYMRGRNERIEELMREPAPYCRQEIPVESSASAEQGSPQKSASAKTDGPMILNNPKVSIWDL